MASSAYKTPAEILHHVCDYFSVPVSLASSKSRDRNLVNVRVLYAIISLRLFKFTHAYTSRTINRDESTVNNYLKVYENDKALQKTYNDIVQSL